MSVSVVLSLILSVVFTGSVFARDIFVDFKNAKADDKSAGSIEQPMKTIQAAVNSAKPGDIIYLREGFWEQKVKITTSGTRANPITISSYKDEKIRLGSEPKALPCKDSWKKIEGTKSWQTTMPEGTPDDIIVLFDGKPQPCQQLDTPPKDDQVLWSTYRKSDRALMVNVGGPNPAERHQLTQARQLSGLIDLTLDCANWIVRGLEFGYGNAFIINFGTNTVVEDCSFHHAYRQAIFGTGYLSTVRRCTFDDAALHGGPGASSVFEDNIFFRGGRAWDEDISHRVMNYHEGSGGIMFKGIGYGITFRYNFCDESGFWPDGNGTGTRLYGNAFHDNSGYGIYNEYADDDTLIIGNYMANTQAGVASSYCSRLTVLDNFIIGPGNGIIFHNRDKCQMRDSFMTIRGNAIVGSPLPLSGYGANFDKFPQGWTNCLVDFNHYRYKEEGGMILDLNGKLRCKTIEEERKTLGWDIHGDAKFYDAKNNDLTPESLGGGTVSVRTPIGNGWKSREMLSDPSINCKWPAAVRFASGLMPSFFWRFSDGNYDPRIMHRYGAEFGFENMWAPDSSAGYGEGEVRGCSWCIGAEQPTDGTKLDWSSLVDMSDGNKFLMVTGKTPDKMLPQGAGWWTPVLPTAPDAKIDVSFKIRGIDLKPEGAKGGPVVYMQFTSLTGQNKNRTYLVGNDDESKDVQPELARGSFDWKEVKQTLTAPKTAGHMALFLGMKPGIGKVHFDDINIKTQPGEMPESAKVKDALPPRLPPERFRETFFVDLAPFVNRSFTDDEANNGIGGWSDQGPNCDMREVKTGMRKFGKVPFNILEGKSLIVLKSGWRNPGTLPEKVDIPFGKKVDTLFFLHSAAWFNGFKYVLHYADGKDVEIVMDSKNMKDWAGEATAYFPAEEGTYTTVAESVASPQFGKGSMYRTEWSAPADRRGVELKSIEFVNSGGSVPILIAITGILEW